MPKSNSRHRNGHSDGTQPFNLILLGDPAAGKATQAQSLIKKYGFYNLDMGKELRSSARLRKIGRFSETAALGIASPTDLVKDIFKKRIGGAPRSKGILFNGTPKLIGEAKLVARLLKENKRACVLFLYIALPLSETIKRTSLRKKKDKRSDDDMDAMRRRIDGYYRTDIYPKIIPYFASRYPYKKVSGMGTELQVWKRIDGEVELFLRKYEITESTKVTKKVRK